MTKKLLNSALLLSTLATIGACSSQAPQNNAAKAEAKELTQDIGSAKIEDKETRLKFLTSTLTEKRANLLAAKKANKNLGTEESQLEVEILDNEILLLEAEMYGLQEGMELNPTEL